MKMDNKKVFVFGILLVLMLLVFASFSVEAKKSSTKKVSSAVLSGKIQLGAPIHNGYVILSSVPRQTDLIADGKTEYALDVYMDSRNVPVGELMQLSDWNIAFPDYVMIARIEIPQPVTTTPCSFYGTCFLGLNASDFFYNIPMNPSVDTANFSIDYINHLIRGKRSAGQNLGVSQRFAILGTYYFTVNTTATLGNGSFNMGISTNTAVDTDHYDCPVCEVTNTCPNPSALRCHILNQNFVVIHPADINHDGQIGLLDYNIIKTNFGMINATQSDGDANGDGQVGLLDYNLVKANFGLVY